jgi:hypothetical protein
MQENTEDSHANCDEELHDILIAISVVAKKLAKNICENHETKEEQSDE